MAARQEPAARLHVAVLHGAERLRLLLQDEPAGQPDEDHHVAEDGRKAFSG